MSGSLEGGHDANLRITRVWHMGKDDGRITIMCDGHMFTLQADTPFGQFLTELFGR